MCRHTFGEVDNFYAKLLNIICKCYATSLMEICKQLLQL